MKPGFYMLAKHGPWAKHVKVRGMSELGSALVWLHSQGAVENVDFEVLIQDIQTKTSQKVAVQQVGNGPRIKRTVGSFVNKPVPIMFFNDASLASYIKLTWG